MTLALVTMIHLASIPGEDGYEREWSMRIRGWLDSLLVHQTQFPDEVFLIDTTLTSTLDVLEATFPHLDNSRFHYIHRPSLSFNICRACNIGIRLADSAFIAKTDIDLIYAPDFVESLKSYIGRRLNIGVYTRIRYLPQSYGNGYDGNWNRVERIVKEKRAYVCRGALQCFHRDRWYGVHGYDERFDGGLGYQDNDLHQRITRAGARIRFLKPARICHRWHQRSFMKRGDYSTRKFLRDDPPLVANPDGWGEMYIEEEEEE